MPVEFLFELGCEEIPARFLDPALEQLKAKAKAALARGRLTHNEIAAWGTPRRLALAVYDLAESQADYEEKRQGPFVSQAFDQNGKPTKAAAGFARSCGVEVSELGREATPKGDKLCFVRKVDGRPAALVLAGLIPELIRSLEFGKSMRWGAGAMLFVRPVHWVLALLDGAPIEFNLDGLNSGKVSFGHRFLAPDPVEVTGIADYLEQLAKAFVMVDRGQRREIIIRDAERLAGQCEGELYPDPGLIDEVTNLVEWPMALLGEYDKNFLKLPPEALIAAMRTHQRYFSVKKPGAEKELLPFFITVANNPCPDRPEARELITRGNQRVLTARLADAEFYWKEDLKTGLAKMREMTRGMVFYKTLGSYRDKTDRLEKLAAWISVRLFPNDDQLQADAVGAARYLKADLTSLMVSEFPELQGIMGGEYARAAGLSPETAAAIRDHYLPRSAEDIAAGRYPASPAGCVAALADKLDTTVAGWAAGLAPTGAGDPFALRRQLQGVINLILARQYHLNLIAVIDDAVKLIDKVLDIEPEKLAKEVTEFLLTRLRVQFTEAGCAYDAVDAGLSVFQGDVLDTLHKVQALSRMKSRADFDPLMVAFKRVMNIIEGEPGEVDPDLFEDESEAVLYSDYTRVRCELEPLLSDSRYGEALEVMASLKPAVDRFFDQVLVNTEDEGQRRNRHALCAVIAALFKEVADFSKVVVEGEGSKRKSGGAEVPVKANRGG